VPGFARATYQQSAEGSDRKEPRAVRGKKWLAVFFIVVGMMITVLVTLVMIAFLVELRPSFAAYWYAGLAAGAVVSIGVPVLSLRAIAKGNVHRWPMLVFMGCLMGVLVGVRVFTISTVGGKPFISILEGTVPHPPSSPSPRAFLVLAWVAFTAIGGIEAILSCGLGLAMLVAPGPFMRAQLQWQARQRRRRRQRRRDGRPGPRRPQQRRRRPQRRHSGHRRPR
jgi:hypothetical protein